MVLNISEIHQSAFRKMYSRDTQRICTTYSYFARYLPECIYDRFGILDSILNPFKIPKMNENNILDVSLKRVKNIGCADIAWSGGIDSSYIIAVYIMAGIPFRVLYNEVALDCASVMFQWLLNNGYELVRMNNLDDFKKSEKLITGDVVDTLFFPSKAGMQNHCIGDNIYSSLCLRYGKDEGLRLGEIIRDYGRQFGKSVKTDDDIVRLMSWSCLYYAHREAFYHMLGGFDKLLVFFDTQEFTDISWSHYWDNRLVTDNKRMFRDVLKDVFNEDVSESLYVQRSFYYRYSRDIRF